MMSKAARFGLIVSMSVFLSSCDNGSGVIQELVNIPMSGMIPGAVEPGPVIEVAGQVRSISDQLNSLSLSTFRQLSLSREDDTKSCDMEETALITVFSTNGQAQSVIDVKLDGRPIGSLKTYFPDSGPGCKSPNAEGVITLLVPAGKHTLEATSPNLSWPSHDFSVDKCECMLLPLS